MLYLTASVIIIFIFQLFTINQKFVEQHHGLLLALCYLFVPKKKYFIQSEWTKLNPFAFYID